MTAKTVLIAAGAVFALGIAPAMAGPGCSGGAHASVPDTVASAEQSQPAEADGYASVPYPMPTEEDTVTAEVAEDSQTTATQ